MSKLDKARLIDSECLSGEFYFQSLIEQAYENMLLSDGDIERLQYECLNLLAVKSEQYNAGDSSSVRVEVAQSLMASILFTLGLTLKAYQNPGDAAEALRNGSVQALYERGRKRIDTLLSAAKVIHKRLTDRLVETPNVFYRSTLVNAVNGFFKLYNADFAAQEIHITADYPLYNPVPKLAGIEFISAYLKAAYNENQFLACFARGDIHHLLCGYAENYAGLLMNIYEPVLISALGCVIANADSRHLDLTKGVLIHLNDMFFCMTDGEILAALQSAADELNRLFSFSPELAAYVRQSLPLISRSIRLALRLGTLERVFITPVYL